MTNHFSVPALTIADLFRCRWQVELFFKWIKQHLRIKAFYGTFENAVKTQIWIAISVYVLVAMVKKRLQLEHTLYTILQILRITLFEKRPIIQIFSNPPKSLPPGVDSDQGYLFELYFTGMGILLSVQECPGRSGLFLHFFVSQE